MGDVIFNNCTFHVTVSSDSIKVREEISGSAIAKGPQWMPLPEAAEKFRMSSAFIKAIAKKIGCIDNQGASRALVVDKDLIEKHFIDNPDERETSDKIRDHIEKARAILIASGKKLYPAVTLPKAVRGAYVSNDEMAKKLGVTMSYFQFNVRPGLTDELRSDPEYLGALENQVNKKKELEDLIEEAIDILDREGKAFRASSGRCSNKEAFMGSIELAQKLGITRYMFRQHIQPSLEGKIEIKAERSIEARVNNWRDANVLQPA
jgi:hypothetical protein